MGRPISTLSWHVKVDALERVDATWTHFIGRVQNLHVVSNAHSCPMHMISTAPLANKRVADASHGTREKMDLTKWIEASPLGCIHQPSRGALQTSRLSPAKEPLYNLQEWHRGVDVWFLITFSNPNLPDRRVDERLESCIPHGFWQHLAVGLDG